MLLVLVVLLTGCRHRHISSTGSTPNTASPEAMTSATPRTSASRARVRSGSAATRKRKCRLVLALGPQQVELRRDFLQIKGDAVRLVRLGGALDEARPAREQADQRQFARIGEPVERRRRQRRIGQLVAPATCSAAWRMTEAARAWAYCT